MPVPLPDSKSGIGNPFLQKGREQTFSPSRSHHPCHNSCVIGWSSHRQQAAWMCLNKTLFKVQAVGHSPPTPASVSKEDGLHLLVWATSHCLDIGHLAGVTSVCILRRKPWVRGKTHGPLRVGLEGQARVVWTDGGGLTWANIERQE